jgi:hypothetical protein
MPQRPSCVLGLAPHSGWAAAVMLGGAAAAPRVLARERIALTEEGLAGSKQPYHALEGLPPPEARRRLEHFEASATRLAESALQTLLQRADAAGLRLRAGGILDASSRSAATLEAILASHALIHTADGNHFRAALARGCEAQGLAVVRIGKRELPARAAAVLDRTPEQLARTVAGLGADLGAPWGADQKSAALIAWLLLASPECDAPRAKPA